MNSVVSRQNIIPSEHDAVLAFQVYKLVTNAAAVTCQTRFQINGAYDVDPVLGSTNTPGFAEWASLYTYYRVVAASYDLEIVNNEAFPVRAYSVFTNTDPGTVGNNQYPGNPLAKSHLLSAKGGLDRAHLKMYRQISQITGARGVETEDNYRAAVTAVPLDLAWLGIGGVSLSPAFLPNGISVSGNIKMYIRFYNPKALFL